MDRLTHKGFKDTYINGLDILVDFNDKYFPNKGVSISDLCYKLGVLEDTECALGISLDTLIKALDSSTYIYTKHNTYTNKTIREFNYHDNIIKFYDFYMNCLGAIYLKEYGTEWALTKEELE